ncbi:transcriptional regulator with XRE-family HTH domain [Streptomyces sp. SAI-124]
MAHSRGKYADFDGLRERAVALRRQGHSLRQIRDELKIFNNDILQRLVKGEPPPEWTKRPNAKDDLRARARELRLQGWTYDRIEAELGCSRSSVSLWVRDLPKPERRDPTEQAKLAARKRWEHELTVRDEERRRTKATAAQEIGMMSDRELFIAGVALYWAEGAKDKPYRRTEVLQFINSDPNVISLFLRWLELLGVRRERLTLRVSIHETADVDAAEEGVLGRHRRCRHGSVQQSHPETAQPPDSAQEHRRHLSRLSRDLRPAERRSVPSHGGRLVRHSRSRHPAT